MHVLLIANRVDAFDERKLKECRESRPHFKDRVISISARLTAEKIEEVIRKKKLDENADAIVSWMQCTRLVFGNETISLRSLDSLNDIFLLPEDKQALLLEEHLLNKAPTISRVTSREFVQAFLYEFSKFKGDNHMNQQGPSPSGPVALMTAHAIQKGADKMCAFPDLMSLLPRAYDAPPAVRFAAWCVHMRQNPDVSKALDENKRTDAGSTELFKNTLVDQVGFPLQVAFSFKSFKVIG